MNDHLPPSRPPSLSADPGDRIRTSDDQPDAAPKPARAPRPPRQPPKEKVKKPARSRTWGKRLFLWGVTAGIWGGIALLGVIAYYAVDMPDLDQAGMTTTRRPAVLVQASNGETFAAFGDIYGEPLSLEQMSPYIAQAVMATEDRRFYHHFGVDPIGLGRAFWVNMRAGHTVQGGSTITQQLAKNLFLKPDRTMKRKIQEALMALWIEHRFTKDQILTIYLNRVYLGSGTFGVDAAARRYFGVSARQVNLYQSAMLAGLLKAPSRYSPLNDAEAGHARTVDVLNNMVAAGMIDSNTAQVNALTGAVQLVNRAPPAGHYFADWIKTALDGMAEVQGQDVVVKTTLDIRLQREAENGLKTLIQTQGAKSDVSQGAVVVMSPDGAVRALVGGKDYDDSQFNRATQALRQPGSSFKPFVYLAGMESGLTPDDTMEDAPISFGGWSPGNYNGKYEGTKTLRQAFAQSTNTIAVKVLEHVGAKRVVEVASRLGITADLRADGSLALGTSEVTPLELTTAYAPFANGGQGVTAFGITEIDDNQGHVLFKRSGGGIGQVISPDALVKMHQLMTGVITDGTGKAARLDRPAAAKTGTTQDYRDAWFLGYTADYVAGVWLGNDDQRNAMKKVTGGGLPAQLWKQIMVVAHQGLPARPLLEPEAPPAAEGVEDTIGGLINSVLGGKP